MSRLLFSADVQFETPEVPEAVEASEIHDVTETIAGNEPSKTAEILQEQDPTVLDDVNAALSGGQRDE